MAGCTLLVTAHPDDEAMFFSPTILYLINQGLRVALLCLSTGAAQVAGGGSARRRLHLNPLAHFHCHNAKQATPMDWGSSDPKNSCTPAACWG
jgi:LmbE family N-acetylglucosaminyl deacetylase